MGTDVHAIIAEALGEDPRNPFAQTASVLTALAAHGVEVIADQPAVAVDPPVMTVEQVITDDTYSVAVHLGDTTLTISPEAAEALAYALTDAALEPVRCFDPGCRDYAAPGEDYCPRHLTDADDAPDYTQTWWDDDAASDCPRTGQA